MTTGRILDDWLLDIRLFCEGESQQQRLPVVHQHSRIGTTLISPRRAPDEVAISNRATPTPDEGVVARSRVGIRERIEIAINIAIEVEAADGTTELSTTTIVVKTRAS